MFPTSETFHTVFSATQRASTISLSQAVFHCCFVFCSTLCANSSVCFSFHFQRCCTSHQHAHFSCTLCFCIFFIFGISDFVSVMVRICLPRISRLLVHHIKTNCSLSIASCLSGYPCSGTLLLLVFPFTPLFPDSHPHMVCLPLHFSVLTPTCVNSFALHRFHASTIAPICTLPKQRLTSVRSLCFWLPVSVFSLSAVMTEKLGTPFDPSCLQTHPFSAEYKMSETMMNGIKPCIT